jgi:serine protease Do
MTRETLALLAAFFFFWLRPAALSSEELTGQRPGQIWRDAPAASAETELDRLNRAFVQLANDARPGIVQIRVTTASEAKDNSAAQPQNSRGSGFIIDPQGYILTAQHVIDKAKEIEVRLADSRRLPARLIAADSQVDLAILKIASDHDLPILAVANSDTVQVGDLAVVFGYPFDRESAMSLGVISQPGRTYAGSASYDFIQTDAGAYAGGSGGPLLNTKGHVIGMITMASERGNMGFATPINIIRTMIPRLLSGEKLAWGWLGVQMVEVSLEQAKTLGLSAPNGVVVSSVLPGQPAARVGLQDRDVILSVNDTQVNSPREVVRMIGGLEAGKVVRLTILRRGSTLQLSVPLGTRPESTNEREG